MLTRYRKGADKERRIVNKAREAGYLAFRSAGSHSPIDVFILNPTAHHIYLIQSKSSKMPESQKQKILEELKKYQGLYEVKVAVE
jgi:Holliday junction resolvase